MRRTPYLIVIGDNEVENNELSIRTRTGKDLGGMKVDKFIKMVDTLVCDKSILFYQSKLSSTILRAFQSSYRDVVSSSAVSHAFEKIVKSEACP